MVVHGNRYATPIEPIESAIENNKVILLDIDVKGSMNIIEEFEDNVISIFIDHLDSITKKKLRF